MDVKYLVFTVIETIIKVVVIAAVVMYVFRTATQAYDFGYRVFADQPVSASEGRTITVSVAEDASVKEIAQMLEEKGLIEDANLFVVQELLSAQHGKIVSGIYDLSTDMTAAQMLEIMSPAAVETEEEASGSVPQSTPEDVPEEVSEDMPEGIPEDGAESSQQVENQ
ncbi:MAG: endolytic transglycosylase MltG [Lachnospiraceae bacterium]|nr:endolytic transglycosylase MltG [Lachnospiraceae bacterium]